MGLNGQGSIYHPNLLTYTLTTDGAFGWSHDQYGGSASGSTDEFLYLGTASFDMGLLTGKPYNGGAFLNYDHTYRDNDFFTRILVETLRYGGRANWEEGPWALRTYYSHRNEDYTSRYRTTDLINGVTTEAQTKTRTEEDNLSPSAQATNGIAAKPRLTTLTTNTPALTSGVTGNGTDQNVDLGGQRNPGRPGAIPAWRDCGVICTGTPGTDISDEIWPPPVQLRSTEPT